MNIMKSIILSFVILLLFFTLGCKNTTDSNTTEKVEQVTIIGSEVFEYPTGISGDEESAQITKQPDHHEISEIVRDSTTDWVAVYRYKTESGFRGTDWVEIKLSTGSNGTSPNTHFEIITIEFTVE